MGCTDEVKSFVINSFLFSYFYHPSSEFSFRYTTGGKFMIFYLKANLKK